MLESVENAREGFEEATDHLQRSTRYSDLVLGPVREVSPSRLEPGQIAWERTLSSRAGSAGALSGKVELRLGGPLARSSSTARDDGASVLVERLPVDPAVELRASFEPAAHRVRWKGLLRALRAELESDESA